MIIWSVISLLLLLIGWLLFTPLVIHLDTEQEVYEVRWAGMHVRPILDEEGPGIRFIAPFISKDIHFATSATRSSPGSKQEHADRKHRSSRSTHAVPRLVRSFRLRRFQLILDTDDVIWNAWLFPVFHMLRLHGHDVRIAFNGHSELQLTLENNIYRLLRAVLFNQPTNPLSHEQRHERPGR